MCRHAHPALAEREGIMLMRREGRKTTEIAAVMVTSLPHMPLATVTGEEVQMAYDKQSDCPG